MVYNEQTYSLYPSAHVKYKIENTKLPSSNDLYFRSKQNELARQYDAARLFMGQTQNGIIGLPSITKKMMSRLNGFSNPISMKLRFFTIML